MSPNTEDDHDERVEGASPRPAPPSDGGAGVMFWLLIALSVATFAPCMILPAWREYQVSEAAERARAQQVVSAEKEVQRLQRTLDAIHNDPAVVARLARRELEYAAPGEGVVLANVEPATQATPVPLDETRLDPVSPPVPVARLLALLPDMNYDRLFCNSPARETLLALSVALFVGAFVVFYPRRTNDATDPHAPAE